VTSGVVRGVLLSWFFVVGILLSWFFVVGILLSAFCCQHFVVSILLSAHAAGASRGNFSDPGDQKKFIKPP
jgi:hypothetical protein